MSVSRSRSSQQSQSQLDPAFRDRFLANVTRATGVAEQLGNRQFAGQTGAMTDAMGTVRQLTQLAPEQVRAGSFLNKNIQDYMNPYQQAVIDTTLSDIERSRQIAGQQDAAAAIRARAFGGSRQGVAQAETNARALEQAARSAANLRAQGFEAATGLMGQELSLEQQANLANQQAALNAAQQRAAAATQLYGMGSAEQQLAQSRLDAERNLELERQQIINQALGLNVGGGSGAQSRSTGSSSSGGISFLS